ncbi:hypothetical protein [Azoarcus indigens]|uniref:Uncharacterized protein n=1 Tax=Azoarcus indigens TaxID=29545 RepID=A0A4R6EFQ0_9RHOO|nr:hypothetical protein [Azoarcus indigens]TDN57110.1 hypothetical protein C7389_101495 [Azoarcus indigens]
MENERKRTRALRRHHLARLKARWLRRACQNPLPPSWRLAEAERQRYAAVRARTPAPCSCWMCGNPRRWGERTLAERRAAMAADDAEHALRQSLS